MWKPWTTLVAGVALVAALVGALAWRMARPTGTSTVTPPTPAAERARSLALGHLQRIARESATLMPEAYAGLYLGMDLPTLQRVRPHARPARPDPTGHTVIYDEVSDNGARVVYLFAPVGMLVTQVQFMSRLASPDEMLPHFDALFARYGEPSGFWDCPEHPNASAMRRITWRHEDASVMEAVLLYTGGIALTLVVAATGDVTGALQRSACHPVTRDTLSQWPVARELRGVRVPLTP